jgi:hypothetical protein
MGRFIIHQKKNIKNIKIIKIIIMVMWVLAYIREYIHFL